MMIYSAAFLAAVAGNMLLLGVVFMGADVLRLEPARVGAVLSGWNLFYLAACLAVRPLLAGITPRHSILLAMASAFLWNFALLFARTFWTALLFVGLAGASMALFWPPLMSWLSAAMEGIELNRAIAAYNVSWSLGAIIGPTLAGWLADIHPALPVRVSAALYFGLTCLLLGAVLALRGARDDSVVAAGASATAKAGAQRPAGAPLHYPAWVGAFCGYLAVGVVLAVFPIAAEKDLGVAKKTVGFVFMIRMICNALAMWLMGKLRFWHFNRLQMTGGLCALAAVILSLSFVRSLPLVFVVFALFGALVAHTYVNSQFHGLSGSANRAMRMAIHEAIISLGVFCGALLGGIFYQRLGMRASYKLLALATIAAAAIQILLFKLPGLRKKNDNGSGK